MGIKQFPNSSVLYRDLSRRFPTATGGRGIYLYDSEGRRYIDASGGALVVNVGHGRREIASAMADQAERVAYVHGSLFTTTAIEDLCSALTKVLPNELDKVYLVNGGTEATETAFKLARQYQVAQGRPSRHRIVGLRPSYHGNTLGSLSASGRGHLRKPHEPLLADFPLIPYPYCYRCPWEMSHPACGLRCADELENLLQKEKEVTISAFIAEPVSGSSAAAAAPPPDYFARIREICDRYDLLLILDEVLTGFGRTGQMFALEHYGIVPDILLLGKGLSSGYVPAGAAVTKTPLVEAIRKHYGNFIHGYTFSHNPVVAAACLETFSILKGEGLVDQVIKKGLHLKSRLEQLCQFPIVGDIRGMGLLVGVELVSDVDSKQPFPRHRKLIEEIVTRAFDKGLLLYPSTGCVDGVQGDMFTLAPPFVIEEQEIEQIASMIAETLSEISK